MNLSIDPVRPYLPIIGLALVIGILFGGCSWGKSIQHAKNAETITGLQTDLRAARDSLRGAAKALRAQNADNAKRIADAKATAKAAGKAQGYAEAMQTRSNKVAEAYAKGLRDAARKSPDCEALLKSDVLRTCGL